MDAVGAPDAQRVDVLARLARPARRRAGGRRAGPAPATRLIWSASAGVQHVGGGQPVVDPAAGRPGRLRQHVDERGGVVVGDLLALVDRLHGERGRADRRPARPRWGRPSPRTRRPRRGAWRQSARSPTRPRRARGVCSARSRAPKATRRRCSAAAMPAPPRRRRRPAWSASPVVEQIGVRAARSTQSSSPGKRASRSSRRSRLSRVVPCGRCWITPASRRTLKWCVHVDLVTGRAKLPQV